MNKPMKLSMELRGEHVGKTISFELVDPSDAPGPATLAVRRMLVSKDESVEDSLDLFFVIETLADFDEMAKEEPFKDEIVVLLNDLKELISSKIVPSV